MKRKVSVSGIAFIFTIILTILMGIIYLTLWESMEIPFRYIYLTVFLVMGIIIFNGIKLNTTRNKCKNKCKNK